MEMSEVEGYSMSMIYSKEKVANIFNRLATGKIDFTSLDNQVMMLEVRGGVRYVGLVSRGKDNHWVLHTGFQFEVDHPKKKVSGLLVDEYVFPFRETEYKVVKNQDKSSVFKYFLRTNERSCFDLTKDTTLFGRMLPIGLEDLFPEF